MLMSQRCLSDLRILVVEDMPLIADEIAYELAQLGCVVVGPAHSIVGAIDLMAHTEIDGALLDVNLGRENSFPIADSLTLCGIPFLFLTAYTAPSVFPPEYRCIRRVSKPFQSATLEQALSDIFFRSQLR